MGPHFTINQFTMKNNLSIHIGIW